MAINRIFCHTYSLPGVKKAIDSYGPSGNAAAAAPAGGSDDDDDDDIDLFGSDEETEEEKKIKADRLAAYAAKKAKSSYK